MGYSKELIERVKSMDWTGVNEFDVKQIIYCAENGSIKLPERISNTYSTRVSIDEALVPENKERFVRYKNRYKLYQDAWFESRIIEKN